MKLFLRGEIKSGATVDNEHDMWVHFFEAVAGNDLYQIWFKGDPLPDGVDFIFARGGFDYYLPVLNKYPDAYKIRYGAGRRFIPENDRYNLVLVDTPDQKKAVLDKYPQQNVGLLIKPAARHFRRMQSVKKDYDICYIANGQQEAFKGIEWVYSTAPKHLRLLHLGYPSKHKPPESVTCLRVDRSEMPLWINKCHIGIVPYDSIDSAPRIIPEMLACGLPVFCFDSVNYQSNLYAKKYNKEYFWLQVNNFLKTKDIDYSAIAEYYQKNLSIKKAVENIFNLMGKND